MTIPLIGAARLRDRADAPEARDGPARGAPTLASSANIAAFNLGNALAAWVGGLVISAGLGYSAPNAAGAVMAAGALGVAVLSGRLERRTARAVRREPVTV